jgi:hypothetical protein
MKMRELLPACLLTALLAAALLNPWSASSGLEPAAAGPAGGFIINHLCTDIYSIPEWAIVQAKNNLHIAYGHTSHGSQIPTGMDGLVGFMNDKGYPYNLYDWNDGGSGGALDLRDYALNSYGAQDLGNPDRTAWVQATRDYLGPPNGEGRGSSNPDINVIMWSWCGQVDGSEADIAGYCTNMNQLEGEYPGVNFVYMTGHLNGTGEAGNVNQRNQQIRDWCAANNKILYDFADIESYDPDGLVNYMQLFADDECNYSGGNWALDWQASHTEGVDWYDCSPAHTQALNGNLKAYAAWWMFARIAGWDGTPGPAGPTFSPTYGKPGDTLTISGTGFGTSAGTVTVGGAAAAVTGWSDTLITVTVPAGAAFGKVAVTNGSGTVECAGDFLPVASQWYFAEGCTANGTFQEYLCLGNLSGADAHTRAIYLYTDGTTREQDAYLPADSRTTIDVNAGAGANRDLSALVVADQAVVAERPMYFNYQGKWTGGHDVLGAPAPSDQWYFAEGYTGPGFDEYICVLNPGDAAATLDFYFQTQEAGEIARTGYTVGPHTRGTFKVNDVLGPGYQTSLRLEADRDIVAERPMYFHYQSTWTGGHCVMGSPNLAQEFYFAEGTTRDGFQEWLTIQNPNAAEITVDAVYQLGAEQGPNVEKQYTVGAGKRHTVYVEREVGKDKDVSVMLSCATDAFLAERPMYFDYRGFGADWTGGHCAIGAAAPAQTWFFAEGYTGNGFHEWLCLQNPGSSDAAVEITYLTQEAGPLPARTVTVPAGSRETVFVNDHAGGGYQLSARADTAAVPGIVVERPMYFVFRGWTGGHDVVGSPLF